MEEERYLRLWALNLLMRLAVHMSCIATMPRMLPLTTCAPPPKDSSQPTDRDWPAEGEEGGIFQSTLFWSNWMVDT
jgi:hypothetical protein